MATNDLLKARFIEEYTSHVRNLIAQNPGNIDLAMAQAIGSDSVESFREQGRQHVEILKKFGLRDHMNIYDLACGSGRTASALKEACWVGGYKGADIIPELTEYLNSSCPGFDSFVHRDLTINAIDENLDIVFAWSLFTHLQFEETYLYFLDIFRALKPGGKLIFSFLEFRITSHWTVFSNRLNQIREGKILNHLDIFLHRDFISEWAHRIGFDDAIVYIDGDDVTATQSGLFGQSIAMLEKK